MKRKLCDCWKHDKQVCDVCADPFGSLKWNSACPVCKGTWAEHNDWQKGYCQGIYRANEKDVAPEESR